MTNVDGEREWAVIEVLVQYELIKQSGQKVR